MAEQRGSSSSSRFLQQLDAEKERHDKLKLADPWEAFKTGAALRREDVNPLLTGVVEEEDAEDRDEEDYDDGDSSASSDGTFYDAEEEPYDADGGAATSPAASPEPTSIPEGESAWTACDWRDSLCAACVLSSDGKDAKQGRFFVFQLRGATRLRSAGDFNRLVPQVGSGPLLPPQAFSPRLSSSEAHRRGMCDNLAHLLLSSGEMRLEGDTVKPGDVSGASDPLKAFINAKTKAGKG